LDLCELRPVRRLIRALNEPLADAYVQRLWSYCSKQARTGVIAGADAAAEIEEMIKWKGPPGAFVAAAVEAEVIEALPEGGFSCETWRIENEVALERALLKNSRPNARTREARKREQAATRASQGTGPAQRPGNGPATDASHGPPVAHPPRTDGRTDERSDLSPSPPSVPAAGPAPSVAPSERESSPSASEEPGKSAPVALTDALWNEWTALFPNHGKLTGQRRTLAALALKDHSPDEWRKALEGLAGRAYWKGVPFERVFGAGKTEEMFSRGLGERAKPGWRNPRPAPVVYAAPPPPEPEPAPSGPRPRPSFVARERRPEARP